MDKSMRQHASDDKPTILRLDEEYRSALKCLFDIFDGHPFVLPQTNRPSRPVYDALMVASAIVGTGVPVGRRIVIQSNFSKAANDSKLYEVLVGRGNTVEAIKERVELAKKILTD